MLLPHNPIRDWMNSEAWEIVAPDDDGFGMRRFARMLHACGLPVRRFRFATPALHPLYRAMTFSWDADGDRVDEVEIPHDVSETDPSFYQSPLYAIFFEGAHAVRRRPRLPRQCDCPRDPMEAGMTDFATFRMQFRMLPMPEGAFSLATDAPEGFDSRHLALIDDAMPAMSHLSELILFSEMTKTLMRTYLGRTPGERVMSGQIRRGDGIDIRAVIWFSDLRESTRLSTELSRAEFLALLNRYFDCAAGPVLAEGGEVLRYIGDAVLAIFPAETEAQTRDACERAVRAARDARLCLAGLNAERAAEAKPPIEFGIGLHVGEVTYGNIGVPDRLEFTVIGEAANRAARLQNQSKILRRPLVVSEDFARAHGGNWQRLGFMDTRGMAAATVYGPADWPL